MAARRAPRRKPAARKPARRRPAFCNPMCMAARGKVCECHCRGSNHG